MRVQIIDNAWGEIDSQECHVIRLMAPENLYALKILWDDGYFRVWCEDGVLSITPQAANVILVREAGYDGSSIR